MLSFLYLTAFAVIIYIVIASKKKIQALDGRILELQHLLLKHLQLLQESQLVPKAVVPPIAAPSIVPAEKEETQAVPDSSLEPIALTRSEFYRKTATDDILKSSTHSEKVEALQSTESKLSLYDRHSDLEKFIGENLINKIGIAILVLAIGYFVKYAIDSNWIGPIGRVGIGILCGCVLIGLAHKLQSTYKAFSSVLVGGGLAVFYFTTTLAYHQFHLFSQTYSFIILIIITCIAVALSLFYDKQELAIIALVGGLSSPFMISGEQPNYHALFIYLILLNVGLLVMAYNKAWRVLNASAFGLTVIVFLTILSRLSASNYLISFWYATILYLLFFLINIAHNVRENKSFIISDFTILLINTALYSAVGLYFITETGHIQFRGLFAVCLGIANLILSFLLFKNKKVDSNILYLLVGVGVSFLSLATPLQLHGHYITLFWAAEAVLLYWFYQKSLIQLLKVSAFVIWGLMLVSLCMDWLSAYSVSTYPIAIVANKGFITTVFAGLSSFSVFAVAKKSSVDKLDWASVFKYVAIVLLFLSGLLEINHQLLNHYPNTGLNILYLMLYATAFVYLLSTLSKRLSNAQLDQTILIGILSGCISLYLLYTPAYFDTQYLMLIKRQLSTVHFLGHWLSACFIACLFYQLILTIRYSSGPELQKIASWVLTSAIVLFLSLELCLISNLLFYTGAHTINQLQTIYVQVGLPILWGLISLASMWLGMARKVRTLRIISLTLFSITLFKLFLFDIKNIPQAGKIVAFFCLGLLLLIVSFMYQKVKKIIVEGDVSEKIDQHEV